MRKYGLDLLKIYSMFLIVVLHFCASIIRYNTLNPASLKSEVYYLIFTITYCCVDCYVLITGYFYRNNTGKLNKYLKLWLMVFFWSSLLGCFGYFSGYINKKELFQYFLPLTYNKYWYFTAYTILYFTCPYLNKLIESLNRKEFKRLLIIGLIFLCIIDLPFETFRIDRGLHFSWLFFLYLFGAYIRIYEPMKNIKNINLIKISIFCIGSAFLSKYLIEYILKYQLTIANTIFLDRNNSIFIVIYALCMFELFKRIKMNKNVLSKLILTISKTTFGIFLIHYNYVILSMFLREKLWYVYKERILYSLEDTLFFCILIFIICMILEYIRQKLFKLFKIDNLVDKFVDKIKSIKVLGLTN